VGFEVVVIREWFLIELFSLMFDVDYKLFEEIQGGFLVIGFSLIILPK
jgi:hypothetical protein